MEDAARLLYEQLSEDDRIKVCVICSLPKSLYDAVSILAHDSQFSGEVPHEMWSSLIHVS